MKVYVIKRDGEPIDISLQKSFANSMAYSYWLNRQETTSKVTVTECEIANEVG